MSQSENLKKLAIEAKAHCDNYCLDSSTTDAGQLLAHTKLLSDAVLKLLDIVYIQDLALLKHLDFAEECRSDWSDYDGRAHLQFAEAINDSVKEFTQKILK